MSCSVLAWGLFVYKDGYRSTRAVLRSIVSARIKVSPPSRTIQDAFELCRLSVAQDLGADDVVDCYVAEGVPVTVDGEIIHAWSAAVEIRSPQSLRPPPDHLVKYWRQEWSYMTVSSGARGVYAWVLGEGAESSTIDDYVSEVIAIEHNRLLRDLLRPWVSWRAVQERALSLAKLGQEYGVSEIVVSCNDMLRTIDFVGAADAAFVGGRYSEELAIVVAEINAGDGFVRDRQLHKVDGFYSGAWALRQAARRGCEWLCKYWDSELMTRYVIEVHGDLWRLMTIGDIIRQVAAMEVGPLLGERDFEDWLRTNR
jgi:hypothetical protein